MLWLAREDFRTTYYSRTLFTDNVKEDSPYIKNRLYSKKCTNCSPCDTEREYERHLLQVAARGNLDEFVKVYTADPKRLDVQDNRGQRPLQAAAAKGHRNIVDFIIKEHGCERELFSRL